MALEIELNSAAPGVTSVGLGLRLAPGEVHVVGDDEQGMLERIGNSGKVRELATDGAYPASPAGFDHTIRFRRLPGSVPVLVAALATFLAEVEIGADLSGSGITEPEHEALRSLRHEVNENYDLEVVRNGSGDVVRATYWKVENPVRQTKIRESIITYTGGGDVDVATTTEYDAAGDPITGQVAEATVIYNGNFDPITVTGAQS